MAEGLPSSPQPSTSAPGGPRWVACLLVLALLALCGCSRSQEPPRAVQGLLDLRSWDFHAGGEVPLSGSWEFRWGAGLDADQPRDGRIGPLSPGGEPDFFPLPALWRGQTSKGLALTAHGRALYRLRVLIGPRPAAYSLYVAGMLSACRVWVDGRLVAQNGTPGDSRESERLRSHILLPSFQASGPETEIVLELSNHANVSGGPNTVVLLGEPERIDRLASARWISGALVGGVLLAMGLYHAVLFALRRSERSNLYFGLFALAWGVATLFSPASGFLMSQITDLPWRTHIDLALLPYGLTNPLMVIFYNSLFPKRWGKAVGWFFGALGAAYILYILATPPNAFGPVPLIYFLLTRTAFVYLFGAFLLDIARNAQGVAILIPGYLALGFAELSKILFDTHVISAAPFAPYGMLVFILCYSVFMSVRFSQAFAKVERLSGELEANNERLLRVNRLKDEFLANSTHELKTPLAGMVGISESLLAGAGGPLSEGVRGHLRMLAHSGKRLSRLVDDVLDHARLEHRDVRLRLEPVDTAGAVRRVLALTRKLAEDKGLLQEERLDPGLPPVLADSGRLEQILFNLVGNSIKYTRQGGVTVSASAAQGGVELRVADTGIGIAETDRERIFESFSQLEAGQSGTTGGAGLGLAIASRLVELHQGRLEFTSQPGQGSEFRFTLPLADKASAPCAQGQGFQPEIIPDEAYGGAALADTPGGSYQVLVVDDEPVNLHVVASCLKVAGLSFRTARSGPAALELLAGGDTPGLVLLDVMMPGQDGYSVCREIRRSSSASALPVVMLTCRNRVEDVVEGFAAGANDYVTKPFSREELVARVSTQLRLREAYRLLRENADLKREVALRRKTEQDLRLRQVRLARILDHVEEAVFALNESRELSFCNQVFENVTGHAATDLLGLPLGQLLLGRPERAEELERLLLGLVPGGPPAQADPFEFPGRDGGVVCALAASALEMEDETLFLFSLRPAGALPQASAQGLPVSLLQSVEENRARLQKLEEAMLGLESCGAESRREILDGLTSLETLLENLGRTDCGADLRRLAAQVMRQAVACWMECTGLGKGELAERSGLWNVYMERDGYLRTQTLDKYLALDTLPQRPRWRLIQATAEYVLAQCPPGQPARQALLASLERLRNAS